MLWCNRAMFLKLLADIDEGPQRIFELCLVYDLEVQEELSSKFCDDLLHPNAWTMNFFLSFLMIELVFKETITRKICFSWGRNLCTKHTNHKVTMIINKQKKAHRIRTLVTFIFIYAFMAVKLQIHYKISSLGWLSQELVYWMHFHLCEEQ